jgi:hypothetical protein
VLTNPVTFCVPAAVRLPVVVTRHSRTSMLPAALNGDPVQFSIRYTASDAGQSVVIDCHPDPDRTAQRVAGSHGPQQADIDTLLAAYSPVLQDLWDANCF